ncbi:S41 family peptidase [Polaribacter dokdonensis]|uniref:Peptidase family S41 n=1 Tax=Polaribacter dokdonensis DSW-5 TaxID=1300348 RepID=A0A0N0UNX8_9FLAO|nr:S41 family peptidase [Polaribacter dokdonensis]KOY52810.1 Peptidase family S41 [Polaribacter dokdonensis DSW-5]SEE52757.1 Peptidase family S41 [Polaribacter dokdonensis DSW-5]
MKNTFKTFLLLTILILSSCEKTEIASIQNSTQDDINYFIWKGLNVYYFWQQDVPDLADNRFATFDDLYTYFRGFSSPETVFESLLNRPEDRFSVIVDDYVALENSFQGLNLSNGIEFGLVRYKTNSSNIFGYVRYVIPNSDAASKNITRGQIFTSINGQQLTDTNFSSLLFSSNTTYSMGFADYNDGDPVQNGTLVSLQKTDLQENPIAIAKVIEESNQKIGYLMYNQFSRNFDADLNAAFANFKSENINDLIIDLRYNPGGSVQSASYLGSMVTGQFTDQVYSKEIWNQKILAANPPETFINNFTNQIRNLDATGNVVVEENINSLGLNRVYIITSGSTASASELLMNALSAYIDVNIVGTTTVGKQVGSITLYDSDNLRKTGANFNTNHNYALQPLVLEITNKNNVNYPNGITPGTDLPGIILAEDFDNLGTLGDVNEPLLSRTIQYIITGSKTNSKQQKAANFDEIYDSKMATPAGNNMLSEGRNIEL